MSNPDNQDKPESPDDKAKVLAAFGGKKGLIDSGIPSIVFLVVFNVLDQLQPALFASVGVSVLLTIIRLAMRETIQHAISGLIGSLICAWFANRTGNASDLYLPKLLTNLGYGSVYLIANLAGWPILGLLLGPILGENLQWRKDPARARAYKRAARSRISAAAFGFLPSIFSASNATKA